MTQARLNILLIAFDSLSETALARLSHRLPTLTRLRQAGVTYENAFACSPESGPARASLMTGLDMAAHGVWTDGVTLPRHNVTVSETFRTAGQSAWLVGRRHLAGVSNWTTEHARAGEYDHFDWAHGPLHRSRQNAYLTWLQDEATDLFAEIFPRQANPDDTEIPQWQRDRMASIPDDLSFNTWIGQQVCARLSQVKGDHRFLGIASFVVGDTLGAAPVGLGLEGTHQRSLEQADAALRAILDQIETAGLAQNTAIVLTASRGAVTDRATVCPLHDDAIKVPLTVKVPGAPAKTIPGLVSTMDIAPTLFDLAGVRPPQRVQGASRLATAPREWALTRLRHPDHPAQTALRTDRWKLILTHSGAEQGYRLFDLMADPSETRDLATDAKHQQDLEDMIDMMIDARVALEDRTEPRIAMF